MSIKVSELTKGEKLLILRRREGLTQGEMADWYEDTSLYEYRRWETDKAEDEAPDEKVGKIEEYEQYFILRKREGLSLAAVAEEVGCCRWWLHQMENGEVPIDRLRDYWAA